MELRDAALRVARLAAANACERNVVAAWRHDFGRGRCVRLKSMAGDQRHHTASHQPFDKAEFFVMFAALSGAPPE
jgi:hypothetical protein